MELPGTLFSRHKENKLTHSPVYPFFASFLILSSEKSLPGSSIMHYSLLAYFYHCVISIFCIFSFFIFFFVRHVAISVSCVFSSFILFFFRYVVIFIFFVFYFFNSFCGYVIFIFCLFFFFFYLYFFCNSLLLYL